MDTFFSGEFADGRMKAYAGDSTKALQKGRISGEFLSDVMAQSSDPPDSSFKTMNDDGVFDIRMEAWTDDSGADTKAEKEAV